jgi:hypothetical protein
MLPASEGQYAPTCAWRPNRPDQVGVGVGRKLAGVDGGVGRKLAGVDGGVSMGVGDPLGVGVGVPGDVQPYTVVVLVVVVNVVIVVLDVTVLVVVLVPAVVGVVVVVERGGATTVMVVGSPVLVVVVTEPPGASELPRDGLDRPVAGVVMVFVLVVLIGGITVVVVVGKAVVVTVVVPVGVIFVIVVVFVAVVVLTPAFVTVVVTVVVRRRGQDAAGAAPSAIGNTPKLLTFRLVVLVTTTVSVSVVPTEAVIEGRSLTTMDLDSFALISSSAGPIRRAKRRSSATVTLNLSVGPILRILKV